MAGRSTLYDLIKSLTQAEKRFFKMKFSSKKSNAIPLKLFSLIEKQKDYDEKALKSKLAGENWLKQFPALKNHLYQMVLQSLDDQHAKKDYKSTIRQLVRQSKYLRSRGLRSQAETLLDKAMHMAEQYENSLLIYEINMTRIDMMKSDFGQANYMDLAAEMYEEQAHAVECIRSERDYAELNFRFIHRFRNLDRPRNPDDEKAYKELIENKLVTNPEHARTFISKMVLNNLLSVASLFRRDYQAFHDYAKASIALFDEVPTRQQRMYISHFQGYCNYVKSLAYLKRGEFHLEMEKLASLAKGVDVKQQSHRFSIIYFENKVISTLIFLNRSKRYEEAEQFVEDEKNFFRDQYDRIRTSSKLHILRAFSDTKFRIGRFRSARNFDAEFLQVFNGSPDSRYFLITKISYLICSYELNEIEHLEYSIRSTYRLLLKQKSPLRFERALIRFFRKMSQVKDEEALRQAFLQLKIQLAEIAKDPLEDIVHDFPYLEWLDSKITGISVRSIFLGEVNPISD